MGEGLTNTPEWGGHGTEVGHVPVLLKEAIDFLAVQRGGTVSTPRWAWAGTVYEIARRLGAPGHLIGVDKDPAALEIARAKQSLAWVVVVGNRRGERLAGGGVASWFVCGDGEQ